MTERSNWIDNGVVILLGLLIAIDGALSLYVRTSTGHATQDPNLLYRFSEKHDTSIPPNGFMSNGVRVGIIPSARVGWAVRYAAKGCEFCRADEPQWSQLSADLQQLGYRIFIVVPSAKDEYPNNSQTPSGAPQISYLNMELIRQLRLTVTPTLLIFDPNKRLIWSHQGTLGTGDPASAIHTIKSLQEKGN